ncbi:hypothetical protein VTO42DRAFT_2609 [Malbranchea cinnamomea]
MASNFRRLAADHASLHNCGLPPNYLFPPSSSSFSDDLTQLTVLLTGPQGTPYSQGLWRLHLRISEDYPRSPPKASFRTRIWHPNVEESTGAVCVDTLKRDWEEKLTLRDVLITISCLLIHPNPDSALNSAAGALLQDDYESFARQARLMTSIHAPIPKELKEAVMEAKRRGEDPEHTLREEEDEENKQSFTLTTREKPTISSMIMKKKKSSLLNEPSSKLDSRHKQPEHPDRLELDNAGEHEDRASSSKENNPSLSPSPVISPPPTLSPRKSNSSVLGKRPLAVLAEQSEPDLVLVNDRDDCDDGLSASERNIAANIQQQQPQEIQERRRPTEKGEPVRKSPKLCDLTICKSTSLSANIGIDPGLVQEAEKPELPVFTAARGGSSEYASASDGKERAQMGTIPDKTLPHVQSTSTCPGTRTVDMMSSPVKSKPLISSNITTKSTARKASSGAPKTKPKPRVGLRRL